MMLQTNVQKIDLKSIDLGSLSKDDLEKVKLMLDIQKIQQDIIESQARVNKMRVDIDESQSRIRQAEATLEQIRLTVEKSEKENKWFPYLQIITTIFTSGIIAIILQYFLK